MVKCYGIELVSTLLYHHRANPTERCNRTLKPMIAMYLQGNHKKWDVHVHELQNAIKTVVHLSTKFSSAFLNFGRHPLPPSSLRPEVERGREIEATTVEEWCEKMRRLENVRYLVRKHNKQAQERQAKAFDQEKQDKTYKKGVAAKLFTKFEDPCKILEVLSPATYLLDQPDDCLKLPKVHSNQLRLYIPRDLQ